MCNGVGRAASPRELEVQIEDDDDELRLRMAEDHQPLTDARLFRSMVKGLASQYAAQGTSTHLLTYCIPLAALCSHLGRQVLSHASRTARRMLWGALGLVATRSRVGCAGNRTARLDERRRSSVANAIRPRRAGERRHAPSFSRVAKRPPLWKLDCPSPSPSVELSGWVRRGRTRYAEDDGRGRSRGRSKSRMRERKPLTPASRSRDPGERGRSRGRSATRNVDPEAERWASVGRSPSR